MVKISKARIGVKMKKIETIRKEQKKLQKFIAQNIVSYAQDSQLKEKIDQALIMSNILIWVQVKCRWRPSGLILND